MAIVILMILIVMTVVIRFILMMVLIMIMFAIATMIIKAPQNIACESPSHWLNVQPFVKLQREDVTGDVLCVLLKHLAPPHMLVPAVLWLCACSAPFLRKAVSEVSGLGGECVSGVVRWKDWMGSCDAGRCVQLD